MRQDRIGGSRLHRRQGSKDDIVIGTRAFVSSEKASLLFVSHSLRVLRPTDTEEREDVTGRRGKSGHQ
jgi:hypothetical protein